MFLWAIGKTTPALPASQRFSATIPFISPSPLSLYTNKAIPGIFADIQTRANRTGAVQGSSTTPVVSSFSITQPYCIGGIVITARLLRWPATGHVYHWLKCNTTVLFSTRSGTPLHQHGKHWSLINSSKFIGSAILPRNSISLLILVCYLPDCFVPLGKISSAYKIFGDGHKLPKGFQPAFSIRSCSTCIGTSDGLLVSVAPSCQKPKSTL